MTESFQNKLKDFAPEPPKGAWEGIVSRLDDSPLFAERLATFEAKPPVSVWQKIEQQLDQKEKTPLIRIVPLRRYAAAAILLVAAGFTYLSFFQNKTTSIVTNTQAVSSFPPTDDKGPGTESSTDKIVVAQPTPSTGLQHSRAASNYLATLSDLPAAPATSLPEPQFSYADESHDQKTFMPAQAIAHHRIRISPAAERYMVYSDAEGHAVRVPRHMFDYVACLTNEADCKKRIAQLQAKVASLTMDSDFTGVLDLLSKLEDGQ